MLTSTLPYCKFSKGSPLDDYKTNHYGARENITLPSSMLSSSYDSTLKQSKTLDSEVYSIIDKYIKTNTTNSIIIDSKESNDFSQQRYPLGDGFEIAGRVNRVEGPVFVTPSGNAADEKISKDSAILYNDRLLAAKKETDNALNHFFKKYDSIMKPESVNAREVRNNKDTGIPFKSSESNQQGFKSPEKDYLQKIEENNEVFLNKYNKPFKLEEDLIYKMKEEDLKIGYQNHSSSNFAFNKNSRVQKESQRILENQDDEDFFDLPPQDDDERGENCDQDFDQLSFANENYKEISKEGTFKLINSSGIKNDLILEELIGEPASENSGNLFQRGISNKLNNTQEAEKKEFASRLQDNNRIRPKTKLNNNTLRIVFITFILLLAIIFKFIL